MTLVEYSDFECPFCKNFHATVKRLVEECAAELTGVDAVLPRISLSAHRGRPGI